MMALNTGQMFLVAAVLFAGIGALAFSALVQPVVRWSERWAPESRHRAMALLAVAPWVLMAAGLVSVSLPSIVGLIWPAIDHCLAHGGHSHLCFVHGSHRSNEWLPWSALSIIAAWLMYRLSRGVRDLLCASRTVRELVRSARYDAKHKLWVVQSQLPLCISAGLIRPRLIISGGLLEQLSVAELEVIAAHEEAHARRLDSFVRLLVRAATVLFVPRARERLLATLEAAAEQACDEQAAAHTGDRLSVAEVILAMERKLCGSSLLADNVLAMGFGSSSLADRVQGMLEPAREPGYFKLLAIALAVAVVALLGSFEQLHHITESLLGHFGH
jgi:hypothetical protein